MKENILKRGVALLLAFAMVLAYAPGLNMLGRGEQAGTQAYAGAGLYTCTFYLNYDDTDEAVYTSVTCDDDEHFFNAPIAPTRAGYKFDGWYTARSGGSAYDFATKPTANLSLYAHWTKVAPDVYDVSFSNCDNQIEKQRVLAGQTIKTVQDPTREGQTFGGWTKNGNLNAVGQYYTTEEICKEEITGDTDFAAVWNATQWTVTLNGNGKVFGVKDFIKDPEKPYPNGVKVKHNEKYEVSLSNNADFNNKILVVSECEEVGYNFAGWYKDAACSDDQKWVDGVDKVTSDIELFAKWEKVVWTVTFNGNGHTLQDSEGEDLNTVEIIIKNKDVIGGDVPGTTATGYDFAGWYTNAECTDDAAWDVDEDKVSKDMTLYAKWVAKKYTVKFYTDNDTDTRCFDSQEVAYGEHPVRPENPTKEGYAFVDWSTDPDVYQVPFDKYDFGDPADVVTEDLVLYAHWTRNVFDVTFNLNVPEADPYPATYVNGQKVSLNGLITEPANPSRKNYVFDGWFEGPEEDAARWDFGTHQVTKDMELWAHWTEAELNVKFNGMKRTIAIDEDGTPHKVVYQGVDTDTLCEELMLQDGYTWYWESSDGDYDDSNKGWHIEGWYTSPTFSDESYFDFNSEPISERLVGDDKLIELYANWVENEGTVTFNKNAAKATGTMAAQSFKHEEDAKALLDNGFTRKGYTFKGWRTYRGNDWDQTVQFENGEEVTYLNLVNEYYRYNNLFAKDWDESEITLYAVWSQNHYTIEYDGNGATYGSFDSQRYVGYNENGRYGASTLTRNYTTWMGRTQYFERVGYTFNGWNTQADGKGKHYDDGAALYVNGENDYNLTDKDDVTVTLYAEWIANQYVVEFVNGSETETQTMTYDQAAALRANTFAKSGSYFKGWATSQAAADKEQVTYVNGQTVTNVQGWAFTPAGEYGAVDTGTGHWCERPFPGQGHYPDHYNVIKVQLFAVWHQNGPLLAVASSTKNSATVTWNGVPGATSYTVYGNFCGKSLKYLGTSYGNSFKVKKSFKIGKKKYKLKNGKKFKFYVVANGTNQSSLIVHTIIGGKKGKYGNVTSISTSASTLYLKPGQSAYVSNAVKLVKKTKKCLGANHAEKFRYVTSDGSIANGNGAYVTAYAPGHCTVYVAAVNGLYQPINVVVTN